MTGAGEREKWGKASWRRWCLRTDGISQAKGIPQDRSNLNRGLHEGDSAGCEEQ